MYSIYSLTPDIVWVGADDRRLERFENLFPLPNGVSYNSYIIKDEKTALFDTVDSSVHSQYMQNVAAALEGRQLDYLIISHMEPDHCDCIKDIAAAYPDVKLVGNQKTFQLLEQFYTAELKDRYVIIKDGDELSLGKHHLKFLFAAMVHWPEVFVTYESTEKLLFTADAFGTFGTLSGNVIDDECDFKSKYLEEARRYYTNIVGKYGMPVQMLLKKAAALDIKMIAPLHGPVLRENIGFMVDKYKLWSTYTPEVQGVVIAYSSMYGNTASAANALAVMLSQQGVKNIKVHDASKTNASYIIADMFKFSNVVFASPTYNLGIHYSMEFVIREAAAMCIQNRGYSIIGNGSWASQAGTKMNALVQELMKNMTLIGEPFEITSTMKPEQYDQMQELAKAIADSL